MHTINDSDQFRKVFQLYFEFLNIIRVCQQVLDIKQKTGKKSSKFVYVLVKQCKSPFNLTNFLLKRNLAKKRLECSGHTLSAPSITYYYKKDQHHSKHFIQSSWHHWSEWSAPWSEGSGLHRPIIFRLCLSRSDQDDQDDQDSGGLVQKQTSNLSSPFFWGWSAWSGRSGLERTSGVSVTSVGVGGRRRGKTGH